MESLDGFMDSNPTSPLPDCKPELSTLGSHISSASSPYSSLPLFYSSSPPPASSSSNYPPNHPLSGSKHFCSICGDRASGKHYGVYSCEGCKGFFKRTVRKELSYACRESRNCVIDKRQRNRCQYCRYMKCLQTGMRREAVQEERARGGSGGGGGLSGGKPESEMESISGVSLCGSEMPIQRIVEAETIAEMKDDASERLESGDEETGHGESGENGPFGATKKKITVQLIEWAKHIPYFLDLKIEDQVTLIRSGWNELMIAGFSFRSTKLNDAILLGNGMIVTRENAHTTGVGQIFDRVLVELISKMKEMHMDKAELGCLRAIILFNPDAKGLSDVSKVEGLREKVYATLEEYTRSAHENEPSRFAKLLLRLPALRSIGLKCMEHLFFYKLIGDGLQGDSNPLEHFIQSLIEDTA